MKKVTVELYYNDNGERDIPDELIKDKLCDEILWIDGIEDIQFLSIEDMEIYTDMDQFSEEDYKIC